MTICARCDKPIEGEPDEFDHTSPTGAGITIKVCRGLCRKAPQQTYPVHATDSPRSREPGGGRR